MKIIDEETIIKYHHYDESLKIINPSSDLLNTCLEMSHLNLNNQSHQ